MPHAQGRRKHSTPTVVETTNVETTNLRGGRVP